MSMPVTPRVAGLPADESRDASASRSLQLALALEHVHRRGVVHCDVKSDNAMVYSVAAAAGGARHAEHALKLVDFGLKIGEVVGEGAARRRAAPPARRVGEPRALRLQRASRADPILARDHDRSCACRLRVFVGGASLTAHERKKPGGAPRGLRPTENLGSVYEGDVRQWSSAAVREWVGEKPKLDKIAKSFEEQGVDGAALLRYADDRPKLKADFKVTYGVAVTLGSEMDRTVRRWPRPIPRTRRVARKCVAVEPPERFESATPIVAELERLALAEHAAILARGDDRSDDGAASATDGGACLPRAERGDDDRARRRAGRLPSRLGLAPARSSRGTAAALSLAQTRSESEKTSPQVRRFARAPHQALGCTAARRRGRRSREHRERARRSTFGRATTRPRARNEKLLAAAGAGPVDPKVASRCNTREGARELGEFEEAVAVCERARIPARGERRSPPQPLADTHRRGLAAQDERPQRRARAPHTRARAAREGVRLQDPGHATSART